MTEPNFPNRLYHETPSWVRPGATFHIRLRVDTQNATSLTQPDLARSLLEAAKFYHDSARWHCRLMLVMPDHVHALLAFPHDEQLAKVVGDWKRFLQRKTKVQWQANFFDHRIRDGQQLEAKHGYILMNPVVKGLCGQIEDWPWQWSP